MPPKRKSISLWHNCSVCESILSIRDAEVHSECCPMESSASAWRHGFVRKKQLFGFAEICKNDELAKVGKDFHEEIVILSQSAMQLCDFLVGSCVLMKVGNKEEVRIAWPALEGGLTSIQLIESRSFKVADKGVTCAQVRKLDHDPVPASSFNIKINNNFYVDNIHLLTKYIQSKFSGRVVIAGSCTSVNFYGRPVSFQIVTCKSVNADVVDGLNSLSLSSNKYYLALPETTWNLVENDTNRGLETNSRIKVGGYSKLLRQLIDDVQVAVSMNQEQCCFGFLLYGLHGTGKTTMAHAIAQELNLKPTVIQGCEIFSKFYGESEANLRQVFQQAKNNSPAVLILDNIETLCPKKGNDQERRIVAAMLSLFDSIKNSNLVVIATTTRPDDIDSSLRRPGRLEREIELEPPSPEERWEILEVLLSGTSVTEDCLWEIAGASHGHVAADLVGLVSRAKSKAILEECSVSKEHLWWALGQVHPTAIRELLVQIPNVSWSDIGGQEELKLKLQQVVEWPLKYFDSFKRLGIRQPRGVLMFGPPGCSKTMVAKALATESKLNFLSVKGSDIFSKWVGDSERAVRDLFRRARAVAPSIVFLDEMDAIGGTRDTSSSSGGSAVGDRVLSQLLTEMDGIQTLSSVIVVGATNRPDRIDKALLRPGRLDRLIYVPLPSPETRRQILQVHLRQTPLSDDVDLDTIVQWTDGYSGAEIVAVCNEASLKALEENMAATCVTMSNFEAACTTVVPRTPSSLLEIYNEYTAALPGGH